MSYFLTNIHVNKIFHLENFDIPLENDSLKHLIITGKNGSGKTILLNAIVEFLSRIKSDKSLSFLSFSTIRKSSAAEQVRPEISTAIGTLNLFTESGIQTVSAAKV